MALVLNRAGLTHAKALIESGKIDQESAWDLTADDENRMLGDPPNWTGYAEWFLGKDDAADEKTKAAWKYPFGKDGKVYRSAIRAIRTRAAQNNETEISDAAGTLLQALDEKKTAAWAQLVGAALSDAPARKTRGTRKWFAVKLAAGPDMPMEPGKDPACADVMIYDAIGSMFDGVTAKDFIGQLNALPKSVNVIRLHVSSPGGETYDALAIANALAAHPAKVECLIEGICASAATLITSGGCDSVTIADNGLMMVHNPMTEAGGTAKDLRAAADGLERAQRAIVATYQRKTSMSAKQLTDMMEAVTWMDADEAVANGFADQKMESMKIAARLAPRAGEELEAPAKYAARLAAIVQAPVNDLKIASGAKGTSIEEFTNAVWEALSEKLGPPWTEGTSRWWVVQTYEDAVIVQKGGDTFEFPLTVSEDGDDVEVGEPIEVEMVWVRSTEPPEGGEAQPAAAFLTTKGRAAAMSKGQPVSKPVGTPAAAAEVIRLCDEAGLDLKFAQALVTRGLSAKEVPEAVAFEKRQRETKAKREADIRAICKSAKLDDLADGLIASSMSLEAIRKHVGTVSARLDVVNINAGLAPAKPAAEKPQLTAAYAASVYRELNKVSRS